MLPPFALVPVVGSDDIADARAKGENWWPTADLAGDLHEHFDADASRQLRERSAASPGPSPVPADTSTPARPAASKESHTA